MLFRDPLMQQRWRRFRRKRRAWFALRLLVAAYLVSLAAELLCNDRPLYVRYEGRHYFPVVRFYPEDTFGGSGRLTRTDYHALRRSPAWQADPRNRMIFPPVPYGPYSIVDPETLQPEAEVAVTLTPVPHVAHLELDPAARIVRATPPHYFFPAAAADDLAGQPLEAFYVCPPDLAAALAARAANQAAPAYRATLRRRAPPAREEVEWSLPAYRPRRQAPETLRGILREPDWSAPPPVRLAWTEDGALRGGRPPLWEALDEAERALVAADAMQAFSRPPPVRQIELAGRVYQLRAERNEVRWPYRPTRGHWLGIDSAGRDVLARLLYGLRTSLSFGLLLVLAALTFGTLIGALQGYLGGAFDLTAQRLIEIWSALPFLYIMILLGSIYGRGFGLLLVCYGIFNWIGISYYMRAEFLRLRHVPFADAARTQGLPPRRIMLRHLLPNALTPLITFFPFSLVGAIGALAALDYLGFGLPPPTPSWGQMLAQAQQFRWAWWLILYPSLALFSVMLLAVFIGEGVRDAFDPQPNPRLE